MLQVLKQQGGTYCTGTCHHRQPGEFHCQEFGRLLSISSQGVKNRLLKLMDMGLVERQQIQRWAGGGVHDHHRPGRGMLAEQARRPWRRCCDPGSSGSRS
jgi:predicted transcriptional regulator